MNDIPVETGIVPFRALGLDEDAAYDAYGNLITYAVTFELTKDLRSPFDGAAVHQYCRSPLWVDDVTQRNKNPFKAKICCVTYNPTYDIRIFDRLGSPREVFPKTHNISLYAAVDVPYNGVLPPPDFDTRIIAFALVSHGENGDGAYIRDSNTRQAVTVAAGAGAQESENQDDDLDFVSTDFSKTNNANYFDDIVIWRTNEQLISAFDNNSCEKP
jgi:hypothetical protein